MKDKTLRYNNLLTSRNVRIDENGVMTAYNEGRAYIEAFSSYTIDGEEVQATWGPEQSIYLKVTIVDELKPIPIFFEEFTYPATDAPTVTYHVLRDEYIDAETQIKTCEVAGYYDEDDVTTQAIPEWMVGGVNIPEQVREFEVVRIGAFAFYERNISAVWIPWTANQIGDRAFAFCYKLKDVFIPQFRPMTFTDAYMMLALFVNTRNPHLRDAVKAYRKQHPDCPEIIGTFINKVRDIRTIKPQTVPKC